MTEISKNQLQNLYDTTTNKEICKMLGISVPTLLKYLKNAGIKLKGKGNRIKKYTIV